LRAMILKEVVEHGVDAGAQVTVEQVHADTWVVTDDGRSVSTPTSADPHGTDTSSSPAHRGSASRS
jgi:hypothetical protein